MKELGLCSAVYRTIVTTTTMTSTLGLVMLIWGGLASAVSLSVTPRLQIVGVTDTVEVAIDISDLGDSQPESLSAFDLEIAFDSTVLTFMSASFGDPSLGDQLDLNSIGSINSVIPDSYSVAISEISLDSAEDLDSRQASSFRLATLTFTGTAIGNSPIQFNVFSLSDAMGNPLPLSSAFGGDVIVTDSVALPLEGRLPSSAGGTDYQAFYDPNLNITLAADADLSGAIDLATAQNLVGNLNINGITGWRLPNMDVNGNGVVVNCSGGNVAGCQDNEMGFLYWNEGITSSTPDPFQGVYAGLYWSGTEFSSERMWSFDFYNGDRDTDGKSSELHAWAVRDGEVPAVVDETATVAPGADIGDGSSIGANSVIAKDVSLGRGSNIGANVTINKEAQLGDNTAIGDGSTINKNVTAGDSLTVGSNVNIDKNVVIGDDVTIGDNTQIGQGTMIGNDVYIGLIDGGIGVQIGKNVEIGDGQTVDDGETIPSDSSL